MSHNPGYFMDYLFMDKSDKNNVKGKDQFQDITYTKWHATYYICIYIQCIYIQLCSTNTKVHIGLLNVGLKKTATFGEDFSLNFGSAFEEDNPHRIN